MVAEPAQLAFPPAARVFGESPRQCRESEVQDEVGIFPNIGETEIFRDRPRVGMFFEPFRNVVSYRGTDAGDRFVASHSIEHNNPELGNSLEESTIIGRLQASHHRGAPIRMYRQQIFDSIILTPRGERKENHLTRQGRKPITGGNNNAFVRAFESIGFRIILGIIGK